MVRAYDDNGNVVDLVEWEKQIRADVIEDFKEDIINKINFEEKWLFACKSNNADTNIAFGCLKTYVKKLVEQLECGRMNNDTKLSYSEVYELGYNSGYEVAKTETINKIASTILTELKYGVGGRIEWFLEEYFEQLKERK